MNAIASRSKLKPARITPLMKEIRFSADAPAAPSSRELKIHPLAKLLPEMSKSDFDALEEDILRLQRVRRTIVLLDGEILDGRHRYRIATRHDLPFKTREFDRQTEGDPVAFVYSQAVGRHMDGSQKAAAAVGFLDHFEEAARQRQSAAGGASPKHVKGAARSRDQAGELFGISGVYVQKAKKLKLEAPEIFKRVFAGVIPLNRAISEQRQKEKLDAMDKKADAARKLARASKLLPWEIITGDALVELKARQFIAQLCATDPKYNLGFDYGQGPAADSMPESEYLKWTKAWMGLLSDRLSNDGSMFVMIDARHQYQFHEIMRDVGLHWRSTIIWYEEFGNYIATNFSPYSRYILYFTKHPTRFTWNGDQILIPSKRQTIYDDGRAKDGVAAKGKVPGNVWDDIPRLVGNAREVMPGFANQLPRALADRIVKVASDPGDLITDPFTGTGTFAESAIAHGRRFIGTEIVERNAAWARKRLTVAHQVELNSEKK